MSLHLILSTAKEDVTSPRAAEKVKRDTDGDCRAWSLGHSKRSVNSASHDGGGDSSSKRQC